MTKRPTFRQIQYSKYLRRSGLYARIWRWLSRRGRLPALTAGPSDSDERPLEAMDLLEPSPRYPMASGMLRQTSLEPTNMMTTHSESPVRSSTLRKNTGECQLQKYCFIEVSFGATIVGNPDPFGGSLLSRSSLEFHLGVSLTKLPGT